MKDEAERLVKKYGPVEKWPALCQAWFILFAYRKFCDKQTQEGFSYKNKCWIELLKEAFSEFCKVPNSGLQIENEHYKEDNRMLNESDGFDYVFGNARFHFHEHSEWSIRNGYEGSDWSLVVTQEQDKQ